MLAAGQIVDAVRAVLRNRTDAADEVHRDGEWPLAVDLLPAVLVEAGTEDWAPATIVGNDQVEVTCEIRLEVEAAGADARTRASTISRQALALLFDRDSEAAVFPWPSFTWTGEVSIERSLRTGQEQTVARENLSIKCSYLLLTSDPGTPL